MTTRRTLTADDVRALRAADSYHVWMDGEKAELMLSKKPKRQARVDVFSTPEEATRRILCNINTTQTGSAGGWYAPAALRALGLIVRPGDALIWTISENGSGYTRAARIPAGALEDCPHESYDRLFMDELRVTVIRTNKSGREQRIIDGLLMHYSLCPNNTARMQRPVAPIPNRG